VPWRTLLCRGVCYVVRGGRVFLCPSKSAPAFPGVPSCSFLFPRSLCRDCWEVGRRAQGTAFPQVSDLWHWSG
jgi:hypothetical protein